MTAGSRPNVILIVSDDHGYGDRTALGHDPRVRTPSLDRLASTGITCTNAYVSAPICSPSRAGIISGAHQARWGAYWFESSSFPPAELPSLAERFRRQGYATGYLGKVHYGRDQPGDPACPPNHGFQESFYGLAGGQMGRLNYLHHSREEAARYGADAAQKMAVAPMWQDRDEVDFEGFLTAELGRRARDFVVRHEHEPFFLMLAFNAVHNFCWQLPEEELTSRGLPHLPDWTPALGDYGDWYDDAIAPNLEHGRDYYLAQLELMDAQIGLLLDELDRLGVADDTVVAYTTDNGGSTCNFGDNAPLRGTKYTLWEGGIRVPLLVRWTAGGVPAGAVSEGLITTLDLTPTLLAATGAAAADCSSLDGVDQWPMLRQEQSSARDTMHWSTGWSWAVRSGTWKLSYVDPGSNEAAHVRSQQHAEVGSGYFLVDLDSDVGERVNLVEEQPERLRSLIAEHERWTAEMDLAGCGVTPVAADGAGAARRG